MNLTDMIKRSNALKIGDFTLASGKKSRYYVDKYIFETSPHILKKIAEEVTLKTTHEYDKIAGLELGGIPLATVLSLFTDKPFLIIRKKEKEYGTKSLIEGLMNNGDKILVIEDVTTTGNSLLFGLNAIEKNGGTVEEIFIVVDREEGAVERLKNLGYNNINVLVRLSELFV